MVKERLSALTGVRFLAALIVLIYHVFRHDPNLPALFRDVIGKGYIGVGLFFILSGFVLGYNYAPPGGRVNVPLRKFYAARLARVYPNYLLAFLLFAPLVWLRPVLKPGQGVLTAVSTLTLTQTWFNLNEWNVPGWSLSNEAFFYVLFPFLVGWVGPMAPRKWAILGVGAWLLALLLPAAYVLLQVPDTWEDVVRFHPVARIPEFLLGVILSRVFVQRDAEASRRFVGFLRAASVISVLCIAASWLEGKTIPRVFYHNGLVDPLWALAIYSLATAQTTPLARWLSSGWMVLLGESSYSLYILQSPIYVLMKGAWAVMVYRGLSLADRADHDYRFLAIYLAAVIGISVVVFRCFEVPARQRVSTWLAGWVSQSPAIAAERDEI